MEPRLSSSCLSPSWRPCSSSAPWPAAVPARRRSASRMCPLCGRSSPRSSSARLILAIGITILVTLPALSQGSESSRYGCPRSSRQPYCWPAASDSVTLPLRTSASSARAAVGAATQPLSTRWRPTPRSSTSRARRNVSYLNFRAAFLAFYFSTCKAEVQVPISYTQWQLIYYDSSQSRPA
jgi:hypothetical protein